MSYRTKTFTNASDIDSFFKTLGSNGFVDWFNTNIAGKGNWSGIRIKNAANWNNVWSNSNLLLGKATFNLVEFIAINSIITNETGGTFIPLTEFVGSSGHPGIAYAFDTITGVKQSYNTLSTNKNAQQLFNDSAFKKAHVNKPFGSLLKDTTDARWASNNFPEGFSGNIPAETNVSGKTNTFITEADFMKFRGRGYIQTTGRGVYKSIISFVLNYNGNNSVINNTQNIWNGYGSIDNIASSSTNNEWDNLFQNTNSIVANYAVYIHSKNGGLYTNIDAGESDNALSKDIKNVASKIAGANATNYINLFYARVMQQLNLIDNNTSPATPYVAPPISSNQDNPPEAGRTERTGTDPSNNTVKNNGKVPTIVNLLAPTIRPSVIAFNVSPDKAHQNEIVTSLGNFPFIWYNSYQIDYEDIVYFTLFTDSIPMFNITFRDSLNLMRDKGFPLDDSIITLYISSRSDQLKPVHMDFKITNFHVSGENSVISGVLNIDNLYIKNFNSKTGNSFDVLSSICKDIGIGFNSNVSSTNDSMTWINPAKTNLEWIENITEYSYKADDTFLLSYIDFYYSLNYVDVEKELKRNIANDLGIDNTGIEDIIKIPSEQVSSLFLTNDYSRKETNGFFESYKIINKSTNVSLLEGYSTVLNYYDELDKDLLTFTLDSNVDNSKIILKGGPQDETFYSTNKNLVYDGKIDNDNAHKNYIYARTLNERNIVELEKIELELVVVNPNYILYKFQKVFVYISNNAPTPSAPMINNRLSGEWLITDIRYVFDGELYRQIIRLTKRELELSPEEQLSEGN